MATHIAPGLAGRSVLHVQVPGSPGFMVLIGHARRLRVNRRVLRAFGQLAVAVSLLAILWNVSGGAVLVRRLAGADPAWLLAGLACATAAMCCGALRWRFTAGRVGAPIRVARALREFYLANFLNQLLPGGLGGDAVRAWRHGRRAAGEQAGTAGAAMRAVIIERLASLMVISFVTLASMSLWVWMPGAFAHRRVWVPLVAAASLVGALLIAMAVLARRVGGGWVERFLRDGRKALLGPRTILAQVGFGLLVTGSCVTMFYCAGQAVHAPLSVFHLLALVPGALLAMSIPISFGGWGLREASAVALWTMAGLPAGDAMASSVLYGLLVLVGMLPGALFLAVDR